MSAMKKAGDIAMKTTVFGLIVLTAGLAGSTFSQMGFLVQRRFGGNVAEEKNKQALVDAPKPATS